MITGSPTPGQKSRSTSVLALEVGGVWKGMSVRSGVCLPGRYRAVSLSLLCFGIAQERFWLRPRSLQNGLGMGQAAELARNLGDSSLVGSRTFGGWAWNRSSPGRGVVCAAVVLRASAPVPLELREGAGRWRGPWGLGREAGRGL